MVRDIWLEREKGIAREDLTVKYVEKGRYMEEDALDLLTRLTGVFHVKNKERLENAWFTGEPDNVQDDQDLVVDTKVSWDVWSFMDAVLDPLYYGQLQVYMNLTKKRKACLAYTLLDIPEHMVYDEVERFKRRHRIIDDETEESKQAIDNYLKGLMFSTNEKIRDEERVKLFPVEYNPRYIKELQSRVPAARKFYDDLTLNFYPDWSEPEFKYRYA